jgi:hypothetical protein
LLASQKEHVLRALQIMTYRPGYIQTRATIASENPGVKVKHSSPAGGCGEWIPAAAELNLRFGSS